MHSNSKQFIVIKINTNNLYLQMPSSVEMKASIIPQSVFGYYFYEC